MDKFKFAIDRGGTFTDVFAICPKGKIRVLKLLSEDPENYEDAPREGIRRILEEETKVAMPKKNLIDTTQVGWIRMGTTVATNALLERKGERTALAITKGLKDALFIGNQSRPQLFNLSAAYPSVLYEEVIEVDERIILENAQCQMEKKGDKVSAITGENVYIWIPLNESKLKEDLGKVFTKGITSLAVVLVHSHLYNAHEKKVKQIAEKIGFKYISLSSEVMPMIKLVPRGHTACVDAYLTPSIRTYVNNFSAGFDKKLKKNVNLLFMQSDGGLTQMSEFCGSRAILSGPAGGVVGYSTTTFNKLNSLPVIGFDMGGTSTDISRFDGKYNHTYETEISGVTIQVPQLEISTVAAGGGSMLFFQSGLLVVGPESAGAHPGPACYRKRGPLTITDANLILGRISPEYFPKVFGKTHDLPLDKDPAILLFQSLLAEVNDFNQFELKNTKGQGLKCIEELALGFITVANETMARPIRSLTQGKGFDPSQHVLACFGGAGGQHACAIARNLGISSVFIHKYSSVLSAYGMALANVVQEAQESCSVVLGSGSFDNLNSRIKSLSNSCVEKLKAQGFNENQIKFETFLNLRYEKTDFALMCSAAGMQGSPSNCQEVDFLKIFTERYNREFGFCLSGRPVIVDDIRVRVTAKCQLELESKIPDMKEAPKAKNVKCYFEGGFVDTKLYLLKNLLYKHEIKGPALIIDDNFTILIEPGCSGCITENGSIHITIKDFSIKKVSVAFDMVHLSVFSHRFMSIAEQMGRVLQRTAISTNIKERLDFSCALFGPDGGLVSNAPHIPVHLGAMQEAVKFQITHLGGNIREGDVLLSNHPCAGGSHLPDLTVITPVFNYNKLVFFVANRGHHADIGGLTPGSMPPHSKTILEEGASFTSFKLVENGSFREAALTEVFNAPAQYPGCSGSRNLKDNISDLKAQIAANQKGIVLVNDLIKTYSLKIVQAYMQHIQQSAESAVRNMLKNIAMEKLGTNQESFCASDYMDDGTKIKLAITVDVNTGAAVFDFTGTGCEVYGNTNTPKAVVFSAIIYCLRCMVGYDIALNQGCLLPIKIIIPDGTILSASKSAAVVGGNVLTSQRIVDVIFKAFEVCAASQGCMNNITFGDETVGYYETVGGGAGAGQSYHGRSAIHTHMTNTRITDAEILEKRYPVILKTFQLNPDSGGRGQFKGGDGVVRELFFRKSLTLSVLSERRVFAPYGMKGGEDGKRGLNLLTFKGGKTVNLGGKTSIRVSAGDIFHLESPGGGGYGAPTELFFRVQIKKTPLKSAPSNKQFSMFVQSSSDPTKQTTFIGNQ